MILVSILALIFVVLLIIGGIRLNMYLHHHGGLQRLRQIEKSEARGDVTFRDDADKIRWEIRKDTSVRATFQSMFRQAWEAEVNKGPQIIV
jgi:hypothetical protein